MRTISAAIAALALLIAASAPALAQIHSELVVTGLSHPVAFVQDPSRWNVQLIAEQRGHIRVFADGALVDTDFLDLSDVVSTSPDGGLLGLAFAPDYAASGRFFVNFTDANDNTVISRFTRSFDDPLQADPNSRFDLVWPSGNAFISQTSCCHYGGNLAFGADGYLYIGMGDGADSDDPDNNAQNPGTLLGKMLRIDVTVADGDPEGYDVPADNPFVGQDGVLPEIWSAGLRNPWRFSFDLPALGGTGALILADVGQERFEEIDYEPAGRGGRNYGWRLREGSLDYIASLDPWFAPLTDPTYQYEHDASAAVIGGFVYRGSALGANYYGRYFFGDFSRGSLSSIGLAIDPFTGEATAGDVADHTAGLDAKATDLFVAFGQDAMGELYIVNWRHGTISRLVAGPPPVPATSGSTGSGAGDGTCTTPDPFIAFGGGTCAAGGWLPPGVEPPPSVPTPPTTSTPSPTPVTTVPPVVTGTSPGANSTGTSGTTVTSSTIAATSSCSTPDPFTAIGGGTCANGGWLPPGVVPPPANPVPVPVAPTPAPTPTGTTTPGTVTTGATATLSTASCTGSPPVSDWVCVTGGWLPPSHPLAIAALAAISATTSGGTTSGGTTGGTGTTTTTAVTGGCTTPDPFNIPGMVGVCINGGWIPKLIGG